MNADLRHKLKQLEQLIQRERESARNLNVSELQTIQDEKGLLLTELQALSGGCTDELKTVATRLQKENRRNAQLLWTTLNFLRQSMCNCSQQIMPILYGRRGNSIQSAAIGVLHQGKV